MNGNFLLWRFKEQLNPNKAHYTFGYTAQLLGFTAVSIGALDYWGFQGDF